MGHYSDKFLRQLEYCEGEILDGDTPLFNIKSFLEAGVRILGGYPGSPIAATLDAAIDAWPILEKYGVYLDESNEAGTTASSWPCVVEDIRAACTYKIVGVNVASDVLAHIGSVGVRGGLVILVGEDPGCDSTIVAQKCLLDGIKFGFPVLTPNCSTDHVHETLLRAFELSEATRDDSGFGGAPVMVAQTTATANIRGRITCHDNSTVSVRRDALRVTPERTPMIPHCRFQEQDKTERLKLAQKFIKDHGLNRVVPGDSKTGFITYGQVYNSLVRALLLRCEADGSGSGNYPILNLCAIHPLVPEEIIGFCRELERIVVVEEGFPAMLEPQIKAILFDHNIHMSVVGKDLFPNFGELRPQQIAEILRLYGVGGAVHPSEALQQTGEGKLPVRTPSFCSGCPEAPAATANKVFLRQNPAVKIFYAGDIGCYTMLGYPPYGELKNSLVSMGNGVNAIKALGTIAPKQKAICFMGDGTFWHSGLTSSVVSAHFSGTNAVLFIFENETTAMTGHEPNPTTGENYKGKTYKGNIEAVLRGVGIRWIRRIQSEDKGIVFEEILLALKDAVFSDDPGLKVIIDASRCELYAGRIRKKEVAETLKQGERVETRRKLVDPTVCIGDHSCMRLVGCPSLTLAPAQNPLRAGETVARVITSCTGLGHCLAAAREEKLCPSFVETRKVTNPSPLERVLWRVRQAVISRLAAK